MTVTALDGVLVVDLTSAVTGGLAGKLLADLGAEVVMLEPAAGSVLRAHGLFEHLAGGKRSVVPGDDDEAATWLAAADVVLTDGSSGWHDIAVSDRADPTVLVDLSVFGRSGPTPAGRAAIS